MKTQARVNERIIATRVRLILPDGENRGEVPKFTALNLAREMGLDLVEVSPGPIPVCKIVDYGKMLYEKSKAERHQAHTPSTKEMQISYNIGEHDLEIKKKKVTEFLKGGHKVIFTMKVKGRERYVARGIAKEKFQTIVQSLVPTTKPSDIAENGSGYVVVFHPNRT
jgi:translation initiation factor IF-3